MQKKIFMDLQTFILNHIVKPKTPLTHQHFSLQSWPTNLKIDDTETDSLHQLYSKYIESHESVLSKPNEGLNSINERITPVHKFYLDFDMDLKLFDQFDYTYLGTVFDDVVDALDELFVQAFGISHPEHIFSFRNFNRCHINYPSIIVKKNDSKEIVKWLIGKIEPKYTWIKEAIDINVYNSGLRMIYSHKGCQTKEKDKTEFLKKFPEFPYREYYSPGKFDKNAVGLITFEETNDYLSYIKKCSIRCSENTSALTFNAKKRKNSDQKKQKRQKLNYDSDPDEEFEKDQAVLPSDAIPEADAEKIQVFLINALKNKNDIDPTILKLRKFSNTGFIEITLKQQSCPFKGRMHRRTAERNVSSLYVLLTSYGWFVRCWDCTEDDCKNEIRLEEDNDDVEEIITAQTNNHLVSNAFFQQTDETIADFIFEELKDDFACSLTSGRDGSNPTATWYYYDQDVHRWREYPMIVDTVMRVDGKIQKIVKTYYEGLVNAAESDEKKKSKLSKYWDSFRTILQSSGKVRTGLMPCLTRKFDHYWIKKNEREKSLSGQTFISSLDSNPYLLGFLNGVWDFEENVFRAGKMSDLISMSTFNDYIRFEEFDHELKQRFMDYLNSVFLDQQERDFTMMEIAKSLIGTQSEQKFLLCTGCGKNGKSLFLGTLMGKVLGDYCQNIEVTMFTRPRPSTDKPSPELIHLKGKRFVTCQEPDAKDALNLSVIKWLTGGDRVTARTLFSRVMQSFNVQATFACICNDVPPINATQSDQGTWRRIEPICFSTKFVDGVPMKPNEIKSDPNIVSILPEFSENRFGINFRITTTYFIPSSFCEQEKGIDVQE